MGSARCTSSNDRRVFGRRPRNDVISVKNALRRARSKSSWARLVRYCELRSMVFSAPKLPGIARHLQDAVPIGVHDRRAGVGGAKRQGGDVAMRVAMQHIGRVKAA